MAERRPKDSDMDDEEEDDDDQPEDYEQITSVGPLNLALTAKSKRTRIAWWLITIASLLATAVLIGFIVKTYYERNMNAVVRMKPGRMPFPAVTFCNMNPYKKSALDAIPQIKTLVNAYNQVARSESNDRPANPTTEKRDEQESTENPKERKKRQAFASSCTCPTVKPITATFDKGRSASIFAYFRGFEGSWECGMSCCQAAALSGKRGRLAHLEGDQRLAFLKSRGVIPSINSSTEIQYAGWIGMRGSVALGNGMIVYSWYDDVGRLTIPPDRVEVASLCATCEVDTDAPGWSEGGGVVLYANQDGSFHFRNSKSEDIYSLICEYLPDSTVSPSTEGTTTEVTERMTAGSTSGRSSTMVQVSITTEGVQSEYATSSTADSNRSPTSESDPSVSMVPKTSVISHGTEADNSDQPTTTVRSLPLGSEVPTETTAFNDDSTQDSQTEHPEETITSVCTSGESTMDGPTEPPPNSPTDQPSKPVDTAKPNEDSEAIEMHKDFSTMLSEVKSDSGALAATTEDIVAFTTASIPLDALIKAGYNISELLIRCSYNGARCGIEDFVLKYDPNYGNCYTFNSDGDHMTAPQAGMDKGLSIVFSSGENEYMDYVQSAGIRVVVHAQNETPFPDAGGLHTPSGYQCSMSMRRKQVTADPRSCAKSGDDVRDFNFVGALYSVEGCLRSCYQDAVIQRCQCGDPRVPLPPKKPNVTYCSADQRKCVSTYYTVGGNESNCHCPPACINHVFDVTTSTSKWAILRDGDSDDGLNSLVTKPGVGLIKVDVYYESLVIIEYVEVEVYDLFNVLLDFSNISGLFLGVSVMSAFELVHVGVYLFKKGRTLQKTIVAKSLKNLY